MTTRSSSRLRIRKGETPEAFSERKRLYDDFHGQLAAYHKKREQEYKEELRNSWDTYIKSRQRRQTRENLERASRGRAALPDGVPEGTQNSWVLQNQRIGGEWLMSFPVMPRIWEEEWTDYKRRLRLAGYKVFKNSDYGVKYLKRIQEIVMIGADFDATPDEMTMYSNVFHEVDEVLQYNGASYRVIGHAAGRHLLRRIIPIQ